MEKRRLQRAIFSGNAKDISEAIGTVVAAQASDASTELGGIVGGAGSPFIKQGYWPRWYDASTIGTIDTNQTNTGSYILNNNTIVCVPIRITTPDSALSDVRVNVVADDFSVARTIRVGVYRMEQDDIGTHGSPTTLVGTLGTINANGAGEKQITFAGSTPVVLAPDIYWLALASNGTIGINSSIFTQAVFDIGFTGSSKSGWTASSTGAAAALPATFPGGNFSNFMPWVLFQLDAAPS